MSKEGEMKSALRPALPLLIGIALAGVFALIGMHSLTFETSASMVGSHHSVGYATVSGDPNAVDAEHASLAGAGAGAGAGATDAADDIATSAAHNHGASPECASSGGVECCSAVANVSGVPAITVHAFPGATVPAVAAYVPVASLLATEAAERPPSRALLSVIRV